MKVSQLIYSEQTNMDSVPCLVVEYISFFHISYYAVLNMNPMEFLKLIRASFRYYYLGVGVKFES